MGTSKRSVKIAARVSSRTIPLPTATSERDCSRPGLFKNGYRLDPEEAEVVEAVRQVASGKLGRKEIAEWLEANSEPIPEACRFRSREESIPGGEEPFKKGGT